MSEASDKPEAVEAAALLKAIEILWDAMPEDARGRVREEHPDVADAAENVANLVETQQDEGQSGG
jgi:2-oxo-4-hydroxy-4-carboxy--5-ureidoimidazoline (OHCU) decarboxylase